MVQPPLFSTDEATTLEVGWLSKVFGNDGEDGCAWPDRFGEGLRKWLDQEQAPTVRALSLFSGGGGLDIGFHDAGFKIVEMVELVPQFAATLEENARPGGLLEGSSVQCVDVREYSPSEGIGVDFIIGGPPCQTFSAAGRRAAGVLGTADPRGTLFEQYVRILKRLKPCGFLFENVYGITGAEGGGPWQEILGAFEEAGYSVEFRVLDAADYGVPQHRERLFIVGIRKDLPLAQERYRFPAPTHGPDSSPLAPYYTAADAVSGADPLDDASLQIKGRWGHLIEDIPPGLNYSFYSREMGHPNPVFAWRSKFSDFMYKADPDVPVRTVKAQGGLYTGPISWENRHFSTAEFKRLQTFPDAYRLTGGRQARVHQLGNSVPPQLARILALSVLDQLFGRRLPLDLSYLGHDHKLGFRTRKRALTQVYAQKARSAFQASSDLLPTRPVVSHHREERRVLSPSFDLRHKGEGYAVDLSYEATEDSLRIRGNASSCESAHPFFSVCVRPVAGKPWHIPLRYALLEGVGSDPKLLTVLWKALEEFVRTTFGTEDLVQLRGYYQYPPQMESELSVSADGDIWKALRGVTAQREVGVQISATDLAQAWGISCDHVPSLLGDMRELGFEIRNQSTNPNIASGKYLIPYPFPTLNPRSVQLHKSL